MSAHGRKTVDSVLIVALAGGQKLVDAAAAAGISERTVRRRLQEPGFRQEVQATRTQMLDQAIGLLSKGSAGAVTTLILLLKSESDTVRLGASRAILELGIRLHEYHQLEQRIAALEQALPEPVP